MKKSLSHHISKIKLAIRPESDFLVRRRLSDIDKYFEDEKVKAFLLGQLLRSPSNEEIQRSNEFKKFQQYLADTDLLRYFEGKVQMPRLQPEIPQWVIIVFGVLCVFLGCVRFITEYVEVGLSNIYNIPIVREGGLPLIGGLLLLLVAASRARYSKRRKKLIAELSGPGGN